MGKLAITLAALATCLSAVVIAPPAVGGQATVTDATSDMSTITNEGVETPLKRSMSRSNGSHTPSWVTAVRNAPSHRDLVYAFAIRSMISASVS